MSNKNYVLGVDVGGTFTDLALVRLDDGSTIYHKTPSTPHDPSEAVARGIKELLENSAVPASAIKYFGHGTTVATNALIVGKVAKTALITTDGFRDILEIRRQRQPHNYDIRMAKPTPPVPRHLRLEVRERTYLFGRENIAPDETVISSHVDLLKAESVDSVAICFLHAYHNSAHEERIADLVRAAFPEVFVCASHEVMAEFREYERISTTVLNASLGPVMISYLSNLEASAKSIGVVAPKILQSNGGVASPREAGNNPVRTLASGPAAGVTGAAHLSTNANFPDIITFDVGGTSTDVCLIQNGEALIAREREFNGYPVRFPMTDVHSVGAGGGSIAWVDSGGFLHVGPRSAGADPGPACYGLGGDEPTVTDANVVLGRLRQDALLGGRMPIEAALARNAIEKRIARPMGLNIEEAAEGILTILNENMMQAIRVISVEQGFDPRNFALSAFGGAGPLLAARLAGELGISTILVPEGPGLLCALGLLVADVRSDFSLTKILNLTEIDCDTVNKAFNEIEMETNQWFDKEGIDSELRRINRAVDMRYVGQSHELTVQVPNGKLTAASLEELADSFRLEHERVYGYATNAPLQLVTFRSVAKASITSPPEYLPSKEKSKTEEAIIEVRPVYFGSTGGFVDCPVYDRTKLAPGSVLNGPAIVEQMDTTTVLPPELKLSCDQNGNLVITIG